MKRLFSIRPIGQLFAGVAISTAILTGIAGRPEATVAQTRPICARYECYQYGDTGPAVADIQRALRIPVDGFYGVRTENAVRYFQRQQNLVYVDGIAGPETLVQLGLNNLAGNGSSPYYPPNVGNVPGSGYIGGNLPGGGSGGGDRTFPYVVVVPGNDSSLLSQVRRYVPSAYVDEAKPGSFIRAGSFIQRTDAEQLTDVLRNNGFDARVAYLP